MVDRWWRHYRLAGKGADGAVASLRRPFSSGPRTIRLRAQQALLHESGDKEPILVVCFPLTEIAPANCGSQSGRKEEPLCAPFSMKPDRVAQKSG